MFRTLLVQVCLFVSLALSAQAGAISTNIWYQFSFTDPGIAAAGCDPADPAGGFCFPSSGTPTVFADAPPWTITLAAPSLLYITDAFEAGEIFEVLDFGTVLGVTSVFTQGTDCGDDPLVCFGNSGMSRGAFALAAGNHSLTIVPHASPQGGGSAYFTVAPEPHVGILMGTGLALLTLRRFGKRRRN